MDITEFDRDDILTEFLTDYIDGNLNQAEQRSFEEYLSNNERERDFARKAMKTQRMLSRFAGRVPASPQINKASLTATDIG